MIALPSGQGRKDGGVSGGARAKAGQPQQFAQAFEVGANLVASQVKPIAGQAIRLGVGVGYLKEQE